MQTLTDFESDKLSKKVECDNSSKEYFLNYDFPLC